MLANGSYPQSLKRRVASDFGHLNNQQAASLLRSVYSERLQHLVVTHVSLKNNQPEIVKQALVDAVDCCPEWINIADQHVGFEWKSLSVREVAVEAV